MMKRSTISCAALLVLLCLGRAGSAEEAGKDPLPEKAAPSKEAVGAEASAGAPETEAETVGAVPGRKQPETLLEFAVAGGWLMVPISLCSVIWLAFLIERLILLRRKRAIPEKLVHAVKSAGSTRPPDKERLRAILDSHPCAAARVVQVALDRIDQPRGDLEGGVNNAAQREVHALRRNLRIFAIVASVAPLFGLLGTCTGLIQAFRAVAMSGLGSGPALAPGIYEALITTAGGLMVAIPSLLTYYFFTARVDQYVREIDYLVTDVVEMFHPPAAGAASAG